MIATETILDAGPDLMASTPYRPCRFCGAQLEHTFVDLGASPLANAYVAPEQRHQQEPCYPLHVYVCAHCLLVQVEQYETPDTLFSDYAYFSSYSDSWLHHAKRYANAAATRFDLNGKSQVIEVASNDGYLLQYFQEKQIPVLGIEPAANIAGVARDKGIPTVITFFGEKTARTLAASGMQADLLVGNNVFAHVPDLNDFTSGLKVVLKPRGVVTLEFAYLARLMAENQFDTIYHEHFSYFSFLTAKRVLEAHGLTVFDVDELPTHGGSLRVYARHAEDPSRPVCPSVTELLAREEAAGLTHLEQYLSFDDRARATRSKLLDFFAEVKSRGKSVVGYGAPAKGNTLLNYCGIGTDALDFTVDRNPEKVGCFLPGTHIPVYAPEKIRETKPDYVLILPWNLKSEIIQQMSHIRAWGGQFVVPIPDVEVLP